MIAVLGSHGCPDVTESLNLSECGDRPVAFGGFGDIYLGTMKNGIQVAIKCARINVDEMIDGGTQKVRPSVLSERECVLLRSIVPGCG
jgi:hypothetical protein